MDAVVFKNEFEYESRYNLLSTTLGTGAQGKVFLLQPKDKNDAELAAKWIFDDSSADEGEEMAPAIHELDIANEATHEHLLHVKYACTSLFGIDMSVLIYEYCEKGDLSSTLRKEPEQFSELIVVKICAQITDAMIFLHNKNIMHRDLKLGNVMVRSIGDGNVNIAVGDFGLCKRTGNLVARTNLGTESSKAPEVGRKTSYDGKADAFGLGVILYELFALRKPRIMQKITVNANILTTAYQEDFVQAIEEKKRETDIFEELQWLPDWKWANVPETARDLIAKLLWPVPGPRASFKYVSENEWVRSLVHDVNPLHVATDFEKCEDSERQVY